jgi:anthranilate synthase/aminodeoxychorismate synthase-like glutamine amidotransferase
VLLVLDNRDSFTFNLVQALQALGEEPVVERADRSSLARLRRLRPRRLLVSPGPGRPQEAKLALAAIRHFAGRIPVLGVCLGHQVLAVAFGARVVQARRLLHGKTSRILHEQGGLYAGLPQGFAATRYHSLLVSPKNLPAEFRVSAWTPEGEIMGLTHASGAVGVQFHPESILSPCGPRLLANFLRLR